LPPAHRLLDGLDRAVGDALQATDTLIGVDLHVNCLLGLVDLTLRKPLQVQLGFRPEAVAVSLKVRL
jgi:hypothetical protein